MSARPNPKHTPGAYSLTIPVPVARHVSLATKLRVLRLYGIGVLRWALSYRIDHLVPLEIGGINAIDNLWPQPRADAKEKDGDENAAAADLRHGVPREVVILKFLDKWRGR